MTNKDFADSLRQIADLYERDAEIPQPTVPHLDVWLTNKAALVDLAVRVGGPFEPVSNTAYLIARKRFGDLVLDFFTNREVAPETFEVSR